MEGARVPADLLNGKAGRMLAVNLDLDSDSRSVFHITQAPICHSDEPCTVLVSK